MAFSVLLTTEMPLLFSDGWLAWARLLAAPLYGDVIGRRTELILTPPAIPKKNEWRGDLDGARGSRFLTGARHGVF
jgi:hypothetical protein